MNELTIFKNDQFGEVRTITIEGEPWFVAADVCKALEISNPTDAIKRLDDDELIAQGYMALQRKLELRTAELAAANKKVESLQPKAAYFDTVASADGSTSFRETAKLFKVAEKTFTN